MPLKLCDITLALSQSFSRDKNMDSTIISPKGRQNPFYPLFYHISFYFLWFCVYITNSAGPRSLGISLKTPLDPLVAPICIAHVRSSLEQCDKSARVLVIRFLCRIASIARLIWTLGNSRWVLDGQGLRPWWAIDVLRVNRDAWWNSQVGLAGTISISRELHWAGKKSTRPEMRWALWLTLMAAEHNRYGVHVPCTWARPDYLISSGLSSLLNWNWYPTGNLQLVQSRLILTAVHSSSPVGFSTRGVARAVL